jgi:hypothetical protein
MSNTHKSAMTATVIQKAALGVAAAFALVGILGFIPGVTTHYDDLEFAGHESGAQLLGLFAVSVLHNLVHLLFAGVGFALARTSEGARLFLLGGGAVYLVLTVYGALIDRHDQANFVPLDLADNWLHLILGLGMVGLGLALSRTGNRSAPTAT